VKVLVPQLASKGRVDWGWLGVSIAEVTDDDVGRLKLAEARGVLIRSVVPGDPAEKGGIKANDVITAIDGATLASPRDLQRIISSSPVGKRVRVLVMRDGKPNEVEVEIGRYREPEQK
jgi:serine protease Do